MKYRETLRFIEHKGPNQTKILVNPTDVQLFEASQQVSHHILIESENPPDGIMSGRGWERLQTACIPKDVWHYVPKRLKPKNWEDFWGVYKSSEHTEQFMSRLFDDSVVVEVGTYHGKSAAHMANCAKEANKNIHIYTIDTYGWAPEHKPHPPLSWFRTSESLKDAGYNVTTIKGTAQKSVKMFDDESIDHLHFDGIKETENLDQLKQWLPKLKLDGTISGLDADKIKDNLHRHFDHVIIKEDLGVWVIFKRHLR